MAGAPGRSSAITPDTGRLCGSQGVAVVWRDPGYYAGRGTAALRMARNYHDQQGSARPT